MIQINFRTPFHEVLIKIPEKRMELLARYFGTWKVREQRMRDLMHSAKRVKNTLLSDGFSLVF